MAAMDWPPAGDQWPRVAAGYAGITGTCQKVCEIS